MIFLLLCNPQRVLERKIGWALRRLSGTFHHLYMNVVDNHSRECVGQIVDYSISGKRVNQLLDLLAVTPVRPASIVIDNGPEFASKAMYLWSQRTGVELRFIQPGKPTQNAFVEGRGVT